MDKKQATPVIAYIPAFSFTLAYFFFQYLLSGISITVSPIGALRSLFVFYVILVLFGFVAYKILKDHTIAGLALWLIAELFLFSQDFFFFSGIVAVILVLLWVGITLLRKKKISLTQISFLLTALGLGLVLSISIKRVPWNLIFKPIPEIVEPQTSDLSVPDSPPDIYYIVVDAYTSSAMLTELYGFDNSEFTDYLNERGFVIPSDSHSNYALTALSVGSTLNLEYVQDLLPGAEDRTNWWLMTSLIQDSKVKVLLEDAGYQSVAIASDWDITNNQNVDIYLKPFPVRLNEFEKLLVQTSPLRLLSPVVGKFTPLNSYASHRKTVSFIFESLADIPDIEGPKFVFTHITTPHPPFIFDKNGNAIMPSYDFSFIDGTSFPGTREEYIQGYLEQVQYVNQQLEIAIDDIMAKSETPPIIIVMADHGSRLLTDFVIPSNTCIQEGYSNFAAFLLPGVDEDVIPEDITPVNVFRIIFDHYFGTEFGLLENGYYFSSDGIHYYQFEDVSSRLHQECEGLP